MRRDYARDPIITGSNGQAFYAPAAAEGSRGQESCSSRPGMTTSFRCVILHELRVWCLRHPSTMVALNCVYIFSLPTFPSRPPHVCSSDFQVTDCGNKLRRAEQLISGLGGEKTSWARFSSELQSRYENVTGKVAVHCTALQLSLFVVGKAVSFSRLANVAGVT